MVIYTHIYIYTYILKNSPGLRPRACQISGIAVGFTECLLNPGLRVEHQYILYFPPTPQWGGLGPWVLSGRRLPSQLLPGKCVLDPGRSIFRFVFLGFDFGLDMGLVLGALWARLGLLLMALWEPKSGQVRPKMRLEPSFCQKCRFSRGPTFSQVLGSI